jgi:hypothetical protein
MHFSLRHNIGVGQFFEQGDLSNGSGWKSFIITIRSDFLQCNDLVGDFTSGLVDDSIGSWVAKQNIRLIQGHKKGFANLSVILKIVLLDTRIIQI